MAERQQQTITTEEVIENMIQMINEVLTSVDTNTANEKFAVFFSLIDWKQAFDRQCPTLGVKSFFKNVLETHLYLFL